MSAHMCVRLRTCVRACDACVRACSHGPVDAEAVVLPGIDSPLVSTCIHRGADRFFGGCANGKPPTPAQERNGRDRIEGVSKGSVLRYL